MKNYVFPTPVGVFPREVRTERGKLGFPHARGGVSSSELLANP